MCQVGVADSSVWHLSAVELRANWNWRIWVDTDDKAPCEDDCGGVTRRDQTADRGRRWCREGRDERQKQEKELWETITQPNNYSFVRISIIFHQKETFLILLELMIPNTSGCMPLTKLFTWISPIIAQWGFFFSIIGSRNWLIKKKKSRTLPTCDALHRSSQMAIASNNMSLSRC